MNKQKKSYIPKNNVLQYAPHRGTAKHFLRNLLIIGGIFLVFLISLFAFIFFSNYCKVTDIIVAGNRLVNSETAIHFAEDSVKNKNNLLSFFGKQNILFWLFAPREQDFVGVSEIAHITIDTDLSKRIIFLHITERDISYIMCRPLEAMCYGITKDGIIFSQIPRVEGGLMFKIDDEANAPAVIGERYFSDPAFLDMVYKTTQILIGLDMRPMRVVVRDHALYDWDALFSHGPVFRFSGQFVPSELPAVIRDIKKQANLDSLEYVDFRAENKVYYK
jgi:hypothetical protein